MLDLQTGEVVLVPGVSSMFDEEEFAELEEQIEIEPERFRQIEPLPSRVGFDIMAEFAEDLPDSALKDHLFRALNSRHPFRYFKDVLCEDERVRQAYFDFKDEQMLIHAREWLDDEDIDAELVPYQPGGKY